MAGHGLAFLLEVLARDPVMVLHDRDVAGDGRRDREQLVLQYRSAVAIEACRSTRIANNELCRAYSTVQLTYGLLWDWKPLVSP
jgi:hypothetical protein